MKTIKIIAFAFLATFTFLLFAKTAIAYEKTVDDSASLEVIYAVDEQEISDDSYIKRIVISKVLRKYDSPLINQTGTFVSVAKKYDLDEYFMVSISGLESYFGHRLPPKTFNPFGWGSCKIYFTDWEDGIEIVGSALRENYYDKWGAENIHDVGRIYASNPAWASRVENIMKQFYNEEAKISQMTSIVL